MLENTQIRINGAPRYRLWQTFIRVMIACLFGATAFGACLVFGGCHRSRAPQSFAPELRGPVKDLVAIRAGDMIWLSWTMPSTHVRNLTVNGLIKVHVCRHESTTQACTEAAGSLEFAPSATGSFSEKLPLELATGAPRVLYYFVELIDHNGESSGSSNTVATLAGAPPPVIRGLTAVMTDKGVILRWPPDTSSESPEDTAVRLHRGELQQTPAGDAAQNGSSQLPIATRGEDLLVEGGSRSGQTLDANVHLGGIYEYRAQRVVRIAVGSQTIELPGQLSPPVQIETANGHD